MVKMLLERDDVDPNKPDIFGQTPLGWAAWHGHAGVVALLRLGPATSRTAEDSSPSLLLLSTDGLWAVSAGIASTL